MPDMASQLEAGKNAALAALNDANARGGARRLALALDISEQAVAQWKAIPLKRVLEVEAATGVPRATLRPDHYGPPPDPAAPEREKAEEAQRQARAA